MCKAEHHTNKYLVFDNKQVLLDCYENHQFASLLDNDYNFDKFKILTNTIREIVKSLNIDTYNFTASPFNASYVSGFTEECYYFAQSISGYKWNKLVFGIDGVYSGLTTASGQTKLFDFDVYGDNNEGGMVYNEIDNTFTANYRELGVDMYVSKYDSTGGTLNSINVTTLETSNPSYYSGVSNMFGFFVYNGEEYGVTSSTGAVYKFNWSASTMTKYTLSGTSVVGKNVTGASNLFTVPDGEMTLSPNYTFNFTNVSGTGLPSFTLPTTGTNKTSTFKGAIPAQTLSVTLSGTSLAIPKLAISASVDNVEVDYKCITTTASTVYNLTIPQVDQPSKLRISVISGKSGC